MAWRRTLLRLYVEMMTLTRGAAAMASGSCWGPVRTAPCSATGHGHAVDPEGRCIGAVAEDQIVGGAQLLEHLRQIAGDGDLGNRIGDLAVFDPESGGAPAVVAGDVVDPEADELGAIEAACDIRHEPLG